jgi:hypothetical protein
MSNYGNFRQKGSLPVPDRNGHPIYRFGDGALVGSRQSRNLYGWLGNIRYRSLGAGSRYGATPFAAFRYAVNKARSMKLSSPIPLHPWIANKEFGGSQLKESDLYQELIFHTLLTGVDEILFWNPVSTDTPSTPGSSRLLSDCLRRVDEIIPPAERQTLVRELAGWGEDYILTGAGSKERSIWRFTPRLRGQPLESVLVKEQPATFAVNGRKVVIEGGRVFHPPQPLSRQGYWVVLGDLGGQAITHGRPFFMPPRERKRLLSLIETEEWARIELGRLRAEAAAGKVFPAAFLYALEGGEDYLGTAKERLLAYGRAGGDLGKWGREKAVEPGFFEGGQPWLSPVYYRIDSSPLVAYDWVYPGLSSEERSIIEEGIAASARFRMRAMDRWTQTANLVFKPTYMVAMAGLAADDEEMKSWGFDRKPGSPIGGYFPVLDVMLRDGGPWAEAPIYPVAHHDLLLMTKMSRSLSLIDGQDWFGMLSPLGGSPRGLMDYYVDTAYPSERSGEGRRRVRVATYGDGATGPKGDLFLVRPEGEGLRLTKELAAAWALTGEERYASFLLMDPEYRPDLISRRPPLPENPAFPPAPSNVWPDYGLAMLRSDESTDYWTSDRAIAALQVMSRGYGHDHRDKFGITLFGAGRLLYPDYNYIQYENPALGWTRNTVAHNTLMVDEQETRNADPTGIRHDFTPEVKFLATSADGVFEGVSQTRALLLTGGYLLDLFHASSKVPRRWDYMIHSLGRVEETAGSAFSPTVSLGGRFRFLEEQRGLAADNPWALDFTLPDAALRLTMAAAPGTIAVHGRGPDGLAMLAVRREGVRETTFVALHEPRAGGENPRISGVEIVARAEGAVVVRIDGSDFTDYAAVAFDPRDRNKEFVLAAEGEKGALFAFRDYGYLHAPRAGKPVTRGSWTGYRVSTASGILLGGEPPSREKISSPSPVEEVFPLPVDTSPDPARLFPRDQKEVTLSFTNTFDGTLSGRVEFDLPAGVTTEPAIPSFGPLAPGETASIPFLLKVFDPGEGMHTIPFRIVSRRGENGGEVRSAAQALRLSVGYVLRSDYSRPERPVYRVTAPRIIAEMDMFHGMIRHLADDEGKVRLDGEPLFTFGDGERELLSSNTEKAFTWPTGTSASLLAEVENRARYRVVFFGDRLAVSLDSGWTRFPEAHFTIPGSWKTTGGPPAWATALDSDGEAVRVGEGGKPTVVAAAELHFPDGKWSLCFEFDPPRLVAFKGTGMTFSLPVQDDARWTAGFCRPGELDSWRWGVRR